MDLLSAFNKINEEIKQRDCRNYLKPILTIDKYNHYPDVVLFLEIKYPTGGGSYTCDLWHEMYDDKKPEESFYSYIKNKMDKVEKEIEKRWANL